MTSDENQQKGNGKKDSTGKEVTPEMIDEGIRELTNRYKVLLSKLSDVKQRDEVVDALEESNELEEGVEGELERYRGKLEEYGVKIEDLEQAVESNQGQSNVGFYQTIREKIKNLFGRRSIEMERIEKYLSVEDGLDEIDVHSEIVEQLEKFALYVGTDLDRYEDENRIDSTINITGKDEEIELKVKKDYTGKFKVRLDYEEPFKYANRTENIKRSLKDAKRKLGKSEDEF